ncbi:MAG: hemolysin family protein [Eubacteriales bacterium]
MDSIGNPRTQQTVENLAEVAVDSAGMDSSVLVMAVALIVLIMMSAFFSATETAFTSLNLIRLKVKVDQGSKRAAKTMALAEEYDKLLSTILIGNNIVNILATTISTLLFTKLFQNYGPLVSTVVLTILILIFGEVSPKSLAKEFSEQMAIFATPTISCLSWFLAPANAFFVQWRKLLSKWFVNSEDDGITEEELVNLVDQAEDEGGLEEHEGQLIRAAIAFNDMEVSEILTPRVDLKAISDTETQDKIAEIFVETGYSRLPIFHETIDNIIGVLHEKDFNMARYHGECDLNDLKATVLYTTNTSQISDLLRVLQKNKAHMAVVVDEYGGTEGIVTLEDILEELVGEIWDEHDEVIEEFVKQEDGSYLIACSANLDDLFELFQVSGDYDASSVSGWVMEEVGRVPEVGDHFVSLGLDVTVTNVENRRVLEISIYVLEEESEETKKEK